MAKNPSALDLLRPTKTSCIWCCGISAKIGNFIFLLKKQVYCGFCRRLHLVWMSPLKTGFYHVTVAIVVITRLQCSDISDISANRRRILNRLCSLFLLGHRLSPGRQVGLAGISSLKEASKRNLEIPVGRFKKEIGPLDISSSYILEWNFNYQKPIRG